MGQMGQVGWRRPPDGLLTTRLAKCPPKRSVSLPTNGFSIEPLKVELLSGEQKATKAKFSPSPVLTRFGSPVSQCKAIPVTIQYPGLVYVDPLPTEEVMVVVGKHFLLIVV